MRRTVGLVFLLTATVLVADVLPSLFYKAKEQFRLANYSASLQTLDQLDAEASKPGNEAYRAQLGPALAFYRGACYAALGRNDEARRSFETYLAYTPNPMLDPSLYPHRVIALLDETKKSLENRKSAPAGEGGPANASAPANPVETGSFATAYRAFKPAQDQKSEGADETWADGPVHYLLTDSQRDDYKRLSTYAERSQFVAEFWKNHDPSPETPDNEFRDEFEKRVAFADARLGQEETRGSLTDRGMLFVLLGPPTWVGRKPIAIGEDTADPNGMSLHSKWEAEAALKGANGAQAAAILASMSGPANTLPESETSWREVWHYRRELLPKGVSYQQVDFEFLTKRGYGRNVLQRDDQAVTTLEAARALSRSGGVTQSAAK